MRRPSCVEGGGEGEGEGEGEGVGVGVSVGVREGRDAQTHKPCLRIGAPCPTTHHDGSVNRNDGGGGGRIAHDRRLAEIVALGPGALLHLWFEC